MTEDQVLDAFKDEAKKLPKDEDWKTGVASIGIEKLEIVEEPFEARFIFEPQSRRLRKVNLSAQKSAKSPEIIFPLIEQQLTEKYGRPEFSRDDSKPESKTIIRTRTWNRDSTRITLKFGDFKLTGFKLLDILYEEASASREKNL